MTVASSSTAHPAKLDWASPALQTGLFTLYCLGFFLMRLAFTVTLKQDDAVRHFETQVLALGYASNDPALYTWLLWAIQQGVGLGLHSAMLLNYALMIGAFWALLLSARMVLADPRWAALAAWSLVLLPPVMLGHFALAHTTQVLCAAALALLAVLRLARYGRPLDYLLLGLAIGFGLLSKYNFGLFVIAALAAMLTTPALRQRLMSPWTVALVATATIVASPGLIVLGQAFGQVESTLGQLRHDTAGPILDRLSGLRSAATSFVAYMWPLLLVVLVSVPAVFYRRREAGPTGGAVVSDRNLAQFLDRYLLACLAVLVVSVLITGVPQVHERYMQPLLFAAPLIAMAHIARIGPGPKAWHRYRAGLVTAIVVMVAIRALELSPLCPQACRDLVPYDRLAEHLRGTGFDGSGTLVTGSPVAAGNLRVQFPNTRVLLARTPEELATEAGSDGPCLAVWDAVEWSPTVSAERALGALGFTLNGAADRIETVHTSWGWQFFNWSWPPGFVERTYEWHFVSVDPATCRVAFAEAGS